MATLKLYEHGTVAGVAPRRNDHQRTKRDRVAGWSYSSIRNNTRFLYSIREPGLTGVGVSLTLTVRACPGSHDEWAAARRSFMERCRRSGMLRAHWVTEWQRRGVPHMHGALWFPAPVNWIHLRESLLQHWIDVAGRWDAGRSGQHVEPVTDAMGWFQYVSKHAARGLHHYQRSPENLPTRWRGRTGRMWGHLGEWPRTEPSELELCQGGFYRFRRMVRAWRKADARKSGNARRITKARRMLACPDRGLSPVRGVSEWIGLDDGLRLVAAVSAMGYSVES